MIAFVSWYLILTLLGWATFPLAYHLFPALADRGFSLARAAGMLVWAYVFWLLTSLGLSTNNVGGILFGLLPLLGLSAWVLFARREDASAASQRISAAGEIVEWLRDHIRVVVTTEVLFLSAFGLLAMLRAGNPTLDNAEKPMELMFINAILRSPGFPPHDGWLSGYAISYYYFGYVMTALLAELSGVTGSIAHNLMTSAVFALGSIGAYGLLFTLLARRRTDSDEASSSALLAPLFMLVVSNLEGFLEVLYRRGLLWSGTRNFWTWLDIKDLNQAPAQPLAWVPDRFWWWWRASRVVSDYDLAGGPREVIDEFPFFSFLHADLHPHVLAIPFILLTVAVALNIFLGGWRGALKFPGVDLHISLPGFLAAALVLGGMAFLNIWDIVICGALIVLAYGLLRVRLEGWSSKRLTDIVSFGAPMTLTAVLLYLPFYIGFSSQAGGLLPNIVSPTRGAQLWVMFAPLLMPLLCYLAYLAWGEHREAAWGTALWITLGLILTLVVALALAAWIVVLLDPGTAQGFLVAQGVAEGSALIAPALLRRLSFIGGLLTMLVVLVPAIAYLAAAMRTDEPEGAVATKAGALGRDKQRSPLTSERQDRVEPFVFLLIILAALLLIGPEFVYLRDQFGSRLNTIFKFYFQAWLLWSVPAAYAVVVLQRRLRGASGWIFGTALMLLLMMSLVYPVLAIANKTNNFEPYLGWTLDDFRRIERSNPDEASAMVWLRSAPDGVVAEAVGGSYSEYGRIAVYTGLPTVLGWPGHEVQWRGTADPQGSRQDDIKVLYETGNWDQAWPILQKYNIRYVVIGALERGTYAVQEDKFAAHLKAVFQQGEMRVYEVP